jgi:hypothetical protein
VQVPHERLSRFPLFSPSKFFFTGFPGSGKVRAKWGYREAGLAGETEEGDISDCQAEKRLPKGKIGNLATRLRSGI